MTPSATDCAVRVRGLISRFGSNLVHDGLDLDLRRGEVLGVVGGSGAGKTVLLDTVLGLRPPDGGTVEVLGVDVGRARPGEMVELERRWGVMFQSGALFSSLTVRENVAAPMYEHARLPRRLIGEIVDLKLTLAGLAASTGDLRPDELSGGMRKRVALARAIALDPELLFLDEPTAGLDPIGAAGFDTLLRTLSGALGLTVFMITHDVDSLYAVCDRVAVIVDRRVAAIGDLASLERSSQPWIHDFFTGPRGRAALHGDGSPARPRAAPATIDGA